MPHRLFAPYCNSSTTLVIPMHTQSALFLISPFCFPPSLKDGLTDENLPRLLATQTEMRFSLLASAWECRCDGSCVDARLNGLFA